MCGCPCDGVIKKVAFCNGLMHLWMYRCILFILYAEWPLECSAGGTQLQQFVLGQYNQEVVTEAENRKEEKKRGNECLVRFKSVLMCRTRLIRRLCWDVCMSETWSSCSSFVRRLWAIHRRCRVHVQCCFTSTETIRIIKDGEPWAPT